ncbi:MAG: trehalose-6-phosphate synthase [Planctomycetota bacterium]
MNRVVVVSNRLPTLDSTRAADLPVGGLASAVFGALRRSPGSLWFGWSGKVERQASDRLIERELHQVRLIGASLSHSDVESYYHGFCNAALWPLLHCFPGKIVLSLQQERHYHRMQQRFARLLMPLLEPGDFVWVHDYHLMPLGRALRQLGWRGRLGFFLHVPVPPFDLWRILPDPSDMLSALLDYDQVGFHVRGFRDNYIDCCVRELGARVHADVIRVGGRMQRVGHYPVGIDPEPFLATADGGRELEHPLCHVVRGRRLILGVDRLDYTKGIPERLIAFEDLIRRYPRWRKLVSLVQIASPSRTQVRSYVQQKRTLDALVGRINGQLAEHDWVPIRYLYRSYPRDVLARFYRDAHVGLVTPLRDGMNLVAKEFIAAQSADDPGVLVLSRFAGAAEELQEALMVNPYVVSDIADGIARALEMSLRERRKRHAALLARVLRHNADEWAGRFLDDLARNAAWPGRVASGSVRMLPRGRQHSS